MKTCGKGSDNKCIFSNIKNENYNNNFRKTGIYY